MKVVVTGAAGFIGSNIVKRLNRDGIKDVLLVDRVDNPAKVKNLVDLEFRDIIDYDDPDLMRITDEFFTGDDDKVVFHQGACSDTMNHDGRFMFDMNHARSKRWLEYCQTRHARFIYASSAAVYGTGKKGFQLGCEAPLNVYGLSKLVFDKHAQRALSQDRTGSQIVGLRYFNVYGPGELHKGKMASTILQFYRQSLSGVIEVFKGSKNFKRDFIYIDDVVDANMFFLKNKQHSGIFNCGTGVERSFYDVASIVAASHMRFDPMVFAQNPLAPRSPVSIREIEMPWELQQNYQKFTQADITALSAIGFLPKYTSLEDGIRHYIKQLEA